MEQINSHIQIPKGILKHFRDMSDNSKRVWYLDIESGDIRRCPSKRLGTRKGYFSDTIEKYLNASIESPITHLNSKIRLFVDGKSNNLSISENDVNLLKKYIKSAMARSGIAYNASKKALVFSQFFMKDQANHDGLIYHSLESNTTMADDILSKGKMMIVVNTTNRRYVVPRNCFYCYESNILAPISPNCALAIGLQDDKQSEDEEICEFKVINDENMIEILNCCALKYEYIYNKDFVASDSRDEIGRLASFLADHREELEAMHHNVSISPKKDE